MWRIHVDPEAVGLANATQRPSLSSHSTFSSAPIPLPATTSTPTTASVSSSSAQAPATTTTIPLTTQPSIPQISSSSPTSSIPTSSSTSSTSSPSSSSPSTSTSTTSPIPSTPSRPTTSSYATSAFASTSSPSLARSIPPLPSNRPQRSVFPPLKATDPPSLAHAMAMLAVDPLVFSRGSNKAEGEQDARKEEAASQPAPVQAEDSKEGRRDEETDRHLKMERPRERQRERRRDRKERSERKDRKQRKEKRVEAVVHATKREEKGRGGVKKFFKDVLSFGHSSSAPIIKTTKTVVQTITTHHDTYTTPTTPYDPTRSDAYASRDTPRYAIQPEIEGKFTPQLPDEIWLVILKYAAAPHFVPIPTGTSTDPASKTSRPSAFVGNPYPYSYPYPAALDATQLASPSCAESSADGCSSWDACEDPRLASLAPAVSFISAPPAHRQRNVRRAQYLAQWRARVALTSVCRVWWAVGQEVVWQAVWIGSAKEGRKLAGRLCGDSEGDVGHAGAVVSVGNANGKGKGKAKKERKEKKGKGSSRMHKASTSTLSPAAKMEQAWSDIGRFILHLHIETPTMDRCSPHDLLIILAKCPRLQVFADYCSVRRPLHPLVMGSNEVVPWKASSASVATGSGGGSSGSRFGTVTKVWAGNGTAPRVTVKTTTKPLVDASASESGDSSDADSDENYDSGDGDSDEEFKHPFSSRPSRSSLRHAPCPTPKPAPTHSAHVQGFTSSFGVSSPGAVACTRSNSSFGGAVGGPADALLQTILSKPLRRLTYTNYDHDGGADVRGGVRYYREVVEPRLRQVGGGLEYLEVVLSARSVDMGGRQERAWAWGVDSGSTSAFGGASQANGSPSSSGILRNPAASVYGAANMLTGLEAKFTTTTTTPVDPMASTATSIGVISGLVSADIDVLALPSLRSLKATLDQATFKVLATWDMPRLTHLSIVAADFSYTGRGFRKFFEVHGDKLIQLELGHSSGEIEQYWLTEPPRRASQDDSDDSGDEDADMVVDGNGRRRPRVMLDAWCPNLKEFVCSADAEWSWETPDWIAPHVLLPAHSSLEFIGVRDMSARLRSDMEEHCRRHRDQTPLPLDGYVFSSVEDDVSENEVPLTDEASTQPQTQSTTVDPYFMLMQQFGSLLRQESFPRLRYLRDLSWESDVIRRTGRMGSGDIVLDATLKPTPLGPVTIISAGNMPPATSSGPGQPKWWSPHAYTPGRVVDKKAEDAAKSEEAAKAALEEAFARSHGAAVLRFWDAVIVMCKHRGVWLEDCRGVNITRNDISRAAELSAY